MPVYKDEKRNTWYFRVYIENYDGTIRQKCRSGFPTKKMAKEEEQKFLNKYNPRISEMTFQELYNVFIKQKEQTLKCSSIYAIKNRFENHILPYFKDYKVTKINNIVYLDWKDKIISKNFSYRYNSELHGSMVSILNYAMDFYGLEKNIASKVGNFSRCNYIKKVNFWTYEEYQRFINQVKNFVDYVFFHVLYFTGMRLGEILALTWNDIQRDLIDINKTLLRKTENKEHLIGTPKTLTSIRKVKIDLETIRLLKELKQYYSNMINFSDEWFVFGGIKPLSQTTLSRKKNEYCKLANVKQIKIHDFRHSHATFLLSNHIPVTVISQRLGHANIDMTLNIYSHLIPEDENKAIDLLNTLQQENSITREFQENMERKNNKIPINRELIN